jgi:HAD superfamily hydrolase (TIGR01548 family)
MPSLQVDAVLFDMDGTLVDESRSYREVIRLTAEFLLGQPVSGDEVEEIKRTPGLNGDWDATWTLVGKRLHGRVVPPGAADRGSYAYRRLQNVFQTYYLGDALWRQMAGGEPPFPWTDPFIRRETPLVGLETLQRLERFKLGIATSRPRAEALMALRQHLLDRFFQEPAVICLEDALHQKPHPAPLQELVRRLRCRRPVYVGDTVNDALAAEAAGMPFIYVRGERSLDPQLEARCRFVVQSVDEVVSLCGDLESSGVNALG